MNYIEFDFDIESEEQSEQLIALLGNQGFEGFEEDEHILRAYIPENDFDKNAFEEIVTLFSSLAYTKAVVENINWNQKWEEGFQPVIVENEVAVRAGFHQPIKNVKHEIIITPKMSFGTGHHATTYMVIQLMLSLDFKDKVVVDFGTGTGVLAILAEKLGASKILAIDYDEWSINNTRENIVLNGCEKIDVQQNSVFVSEQLSDIILANITLNVIKDNLAKMAQNLKKSGKILLSGFLKDDEGNLTDILKLYELEVISILQKGNWIAILAEKC